MMRIAEPKVRIHFPPAGSQVRTRPHGFGDPPPASHAPAPPIASTETLRRGASDKPQTDGFWPLLTLGYVDGDALPFRQAHDAGTLQRRGVHEDIPSTLIWSDKAKPLIGIVPFHRAQLFDGRAVARRICRSLRPRTPRRLLRRGAGIHADDLGHLRPLRSRADAHLKRRARRYAAVATTLRHAYMQEGIAGAIRELHEAESLLGIVPFDGGADGWT